jgi:hypothetical protein
MENVTVTPLSTSGYKLSSFVAVLLYELIEGAASAVEGIKNSIAIKRANLYFNL